MGLLPTFSRTLAGLAFALALTAFASPPPQGEAPSFAELHAKAVTRLIAGLEAHAEWSAGKELYIERDRCYRAILELDPENATARKGLRFSRKPDGSWVEPAPREAKNFNAAAVLELPAKRQALVAPFAKEMFAALDTFHCDDVLRGLVYREILTGDPDDAPTRALLGEVKFGDAWVLLETQIAKKRRVEMKELVARAIEGSGKLTVAEVTPLESSMGLTFTQHYQTAHVRVFSTGALPEVETTARACEAAGDLLRFAFDTDTQHKEGFTIFMLANGTESAPVLDKLPGIDPAYREFLKKVVGAKIPNQPYVVSWDKDPKKRIDGSVRQTVGDFLDRGFGLTLQAGWAWEGLGLYLTRELVGTRLTWFIQSDGGAKLDTLKARLLKPDANWINEGFELLKQPDHPSFALMLDRELNSLTLEDVLYAYALAAYFVEARPSEGARVLQRIGQGAGSGREKTSEAVKAVMKLDPGALERRLTRWLSERR